MSYNWECPYCGRHVCLTNQSYDSESGYVSTGDPSKDGDLNFEILYVVCPNLECKEYTIKVQFYKREKVKNQYGTFEHPNGKEIISAWLRPKGLAKPLPTYIPAVLREDYQEACLIMQDSPKASAALSRRCLQALIRRYYEDKVKPGRLYDEIQTLKGIFPPNLWEAVDGIREVGNVGAHSEKDVNVIVDVPPEAAQALIGLIELLFEETYIKDNDREKRIKKAREAAEGIANQKAGNSSGNDTSDPETEG